MRTKHFFTIGWCILFLSSCQLTEQGDNDIVIDVDDDFRFTFLENLRTPEDDLIFFLESIRNKECEGDTVKLDLNHLESAIALNIDVINPSGPCLPGVSRIKTRANTNLLKKDRMVLSIKLESLIANQGDILRDNDGFSIKMETTYGFYLPYESMKRVPENLVWGYVGFPNNYRLVAQEFVQRLVPLTEAKDLGEGNYGYFEVSKEKNISVLEELETTLSTQTFLRGFAVSNFRQVEALVNEYQEKYPAMEFFLRDSYGKIIK
jgi:hypothetical protein